METPNAHSEGSPACELCGGLLLYHRAKNEAPKWTCQACGHVATLTSATTTEVRLVEPNQRIPSDLVAQHGPFYGRIETAPNGTIIGIVAFQNPASPTTGKAQRHAIKIGQADIVDLANLVAELAVKVADHVEAIPFAEPSDDDLIDIPLTQGERDDGPPEASEPVRAAGPPGSDGNTATAPDGRDRRAAGGPGVPGTPGSDSPDTAPTNASSAPTGPDSAPATGADASEAGPSPASPEQDAG